MTLSQLVNALGSMLLSGAVKGAVAGSEVMLRDKLAIEWQVADSVFIRKIEVGKGHAFVVGRPGERLGAGGQWLKFPEFDDRAPRPDFAARQAEFNAQTQFAAFDDALKCFLAAGKEGP